MLRRRQCHSVRLTHRMYLGQLRASLPGSPAASLPWAEPFYIRPEGEEEKILILDVMPRWWDVKEVDLPFCYLFRGNEFHKLYLRHLHFGTWRIRILEEEKKRRRRRIFISGWVNCQLIVVHPTEYISKEWNSVLNDCPKIYDKINFRICSASFSEWMIP